MNYVKPGETEGPPDTTESLIIGKGKPFIGGWIRSVLTRFAPLVQVWQGSIANEKRVNLGLWDIPSWARDRVVASSALARSCPDLVFLGSFVVYVLTLAPTLFGFDAAEFSAVAYNLGVPHATGYPLYVLIGKLFTYLPFGDVAYRLNLMSALFAAGTVTVVYLLALLVTRRVILSVAIAGFLAFSYYFWASAVIAEVYSLHAFLNALTIYLLLRWNREDNDWLLYGSAVAWGLSFGNHMTTALLGPAIAFSIGIGLWRRRIKRQHLLPLAACFLVPLAVYAYLPLRYLAGAEPYVMSHYNAEGMLVRVDTTTLEGMWWVLTAKQFDFLFRAYQGPGFFEQLENLMFLTVYANFLGVGVVLGALGLFRNYLVDKQRLIFLGLVFAGNILFFADYGALDKQFMLVTCVVVWAVWMADGIYYISSSIERLSPDQWRGRLNSIIGQRVKQVRWEIFAVLLPAVALWVNFSYADLSSFTLIRDTYPRIMKSFAPDAMVFAWWPDAAPMQYYQLVEEMRPDVQIVDRFLISKEDEIKLIDTALPHRPVYVFTSAVIGDFPWVRAAPPPHHRYEEDPKLWGTVDKVYKVSPVN